MKVLVTGGAGFIGSALVRHLMEHGGIDILNVDKMTYAATKGSLKAVEGHTGYNFIKADVADAGAMAEVFGAFNPDLVFHLAAESHVDRSITHSDAFVQTNVLGTCCLLEAALRHFDTLKGAAKDRFRFVLVSTDEVYGALGETGLFSETSPYDPSSPYSASKAAADHFAMAWHRTFALPVILTNCSNNYGPFQFPEKLIPLTILNALEGKPLPIYGDGRQVRDWLYVDDHVRALLQIAKKGVPGERYNVGARGERRNIKVVRAICRLLDARHPSGAPHDRLISFVADRPGHDARYAIDPSKLEAEIGWRPEQDFASGLAKTVDWYCRNDWWWQPLRETRYAGKRLGLIDAAEGA